MNKRKKRKYSIKSKERLYRHQAQAQQTANMTDEEEWRMEEPSIKLSRAFVVVLILHIVAVGGILAWEMLKKAVPDEEKLTSDTRQTPAQQVQRTSGQPVLPPLNVKPYQGNDPGMAVVETPRHDTSQPQYLTYSIQQGDNLEEIAQRYGTSWQNIKEMNQIGNANQIKIGVALKVPNPEWRGVTREPQVVRGNLPTETQQVEKAMFETPRRQQPQPLPRQAQLAPPVQPRPAAVVQQSSGGSGTYTIVAGDTAFGIAKRHGVTVNALLAHNGISDPTKLQPGARLKIPR